VWNKIIEPNIEKKSLGRFARASKTRRFDGAQKQDKNKKVFFSDS